MNEVDEMQNMFCAIFGEPESRHDPDWLTSFGLFAIGWESGKAFQQRVQNDLAPASENQGVLDTPPAV